MIPHVPLEDNVGDILGKAQRGLGLTDADVRAKSGLTPDEWTALKAVPTAEVLGKIAPVLGLDAARLAVLAAGDWRPAAVPEFPGFAMLNLPFGDMTVNQYLAWDVATHQGVVFDTGPAAAPMLGRIAAEKLEVELILITHAHIDHVMALPDLIAGTKAPAWLNGRDRDEEDLPPGTGVKFFDAGREFAVGNLRIESRLTSGHSAGQTTFVVHGLARPLAIVGDSLFAASMGGSRTAYREQLENNRAQILTLPDDTILACGHGPLTTVGEEKRHNPFFAHR